MRALPVLARGCFAQELRYGDAVGGCVERGPKLVKRCVRHHDVESAQRIFELRL